MRLPLQERLLKYSQPDAATGCRLWTGKLTKGGYGRLWYEGRPQIAHRLAYAAARGEIGSQLLLSHTCGRLECINPDHLIRVTRSENSKARWAREPSVEERLAAYSERNENGCLIWKRRRDRNGYGVIAYRGVARLAHRVAYEVACGPIPDGLMVCHHCDTPACVNPDHFFLGTAADNAADMVSKGRHNPKYGADHWRTKLTNGQVLSLVEEARSARRGEINDIAMRYGVSHSHVCKLRNGLRRQKACGAIT